MLATCFPPCKMRTGWDGKGGGRLTSLEYAATSLELPCRAGNYRLRMSTLLKRQWPMLFFLSQTLSSKTKLSCSSYPFLKRPRFLFNDQVQLRCRVCALLTNRKCKREGNIEVLLFSFSGRKQPGFLFLILYQERAHFVKYLIL